MSILKTLKVAVAGAILVIPAFAYAQAYGTVATQTLNVREGAKLDSSIVKQVGLGESVEIVYQQNGWLKIILPGDERAYVKAEYINVHRAVAVVDVNDGLNVRDYPSTENGNIIGRFEPGDEISVMCRVGDWYKVNQEGFEGFVHKDYIKNSNEEVDFLSYLPTIKLTEVRRMTLTQEEAMAIMVEVEEEEVVEQTNNSTTDSSSSKPSTNSSSSSSSKPSTNSSSSSSSKPSTNSSSSSSSKPSTNSNSSSSSKPSSGSSSSNSGSTSTGSATGQAIVNYAMQFLGNPYVYGGNSLTNGVDCSGFTSQVMKHFGISLYRNSAAQYANNGYYVSSDNLQPGDLTFYGYNGQVSHVAIYIGGGQIIHANDERTGICIGNAFPTRGKKYIGAKRVI